MCSRVLLWFGKLPQWNLHVNGTTFESGLSFQGCSQWNCHVNGTTFQSSLRFQTGLSSLRVSCKRALKYLVYCQVVWHTIKPGTPEHGTLAEQWRNNGTPWNTKVKPAEHPGTTEPYKTKNNYNDFKENLNLTLIHLTLSTEGGNIFCCWY